MGDHSFIRKKGGFQINVHFDEGAKHFVRTLQFIRNTWEAVGHIERDADSPISVMQFYMQDSACIQAVTEKDPLVFGLFVVTVDTLSVDEGANRIIELRQDMNTEVLDNNQEENF